MSPLFFSGTPRATGSDRAPESPQCAEFARESGALVRASKVLSAYFRALKDLASFNSNGVSDAGAQTGSNIGLVNGLNMTQLDSVSKLASVLTETFTKGYRQRDLVKLLSQADPSIASVTQGFQDIAGRDYEALLREEQRTLTARDIRLPPGAKIWERYCC